MLILITCVIAGGVSAQPSFSPDQGKIPLKIQFTFPGGDACDSVSWEFGDGETSRETGPQHTYQNMGFFYPRVICTLPGATVTYAFDKIVGSNAEMPDADSNDQHYPVETIVEISPATPGLDDLLKQADGLYALGLSGYAADAYKKAIPLSGSDPQVIGKYGDILASLSRWSEAATAYNQSLSKNEDPVVLNAYGGMLIKLNRHQDALDVFNRTLAINAKNPVALTGKGKAFEMLVMPNESAEAYKQSVALDAKQAAAWIGYGNVLNTLEKYPESIAAYEKAIGLGISGADIYNRYGAVLRKAGRDGDAARAMSTARSYQGQLYSGAHDYMPRCSIGAMG